MKRPGPAAESALVTLGIIIAVGVVLSILTVVPSGNSVPVAAGSTDGSLPASTSTGPAADQTAANSPIGTQPAAKSGGASVKPGTVSTNQTAVAPAPAGLACAAGKNGGSTAPGVTGNQILMAATTVTDGPGASFLGPTEEAIQAVQNQVNRSGGICGRTLNIQMRNDGWSEALGSQYIQNFVDGSHVFGLAVNPDSEGIYGADAFIRQNGIPVVGTEGMLIHEYQNPWIWPVGTSTISQMHVMARDAYQRGARNFSIVFDAKYHFGVEGAYAFEKAVERLTGHPIPGYNSNLTSCSGRFCGIQPDQPSYTSQAQQFNNSCAQKPLCEFTAYLLEPNVALSWLDASNGGQISPKFGNAGAQPLFDREAFADQCGGTCSSSYRWDVWTSFQPPEGSFGGQPAEAAYVQLMHGLDSNLDVDNQFVEGAYIGMNLLVTALKQTGPDLTRQRLQAVLNSMTFKSGLGKPLTYTAANHFANTAAMAWRMQYSNGTFSGYSAEGGFASDPWPNQDIRSGN